MTDQMTKQEQRVLEGAWEEIALHAEEFAGRHVKVTVYPGDASNGDTAPKMLSETLAPFLEKARQLKKGTPVPHTDRHEIAFGEILAEKKRQGHL
jgi:hypothetical protein